jgi:hypothetical protein
LVCPNGAIVSSGKAVKKDIPSKEVKANQMFGLSKKANIITEIVIGICLLALGYYLGKKTKPKVVKKNRGIELKDELVE